VLLFVCPGLKQGQVNEFVRLHRSVYFGTVYAMYDAKLAAVTMV